MSPHNRYHDYRARVYYQDTDVGGVVYHARYADFAERARCEFLRDLGISVVQLQARDNILLVVKKITLEFYRGAELDDDLRIHSDVLHIGGASVSLRQEFYRPEHHEADAAMTHLASLDVVLVGVGRAAHGFKPQALPADVKQALTPYMRADLSDTHISKDNSPKED